MKRYSTRYPIAVAALVVLGMTLSYADSSISNKTESTSVTTQESNQVKPTPEMKWTELRGKVQHIDLNANVVQIKEKGTDKLVEVPVTDTIVVMDSSNHALSLGDLKEGQKVIIRNTQKPS